MKAETDAISLFLRTDGTLMLSSSSGAVEFRLTPAQLLKLGVDMLSLASALDPACMEAAANAMASTYIAQPAEMLPCTPLLN